MARDAITVTTVTQAGAEQAAGVTGVAANDRKITAPTAGSRIMLAITNSGGSPHTVSLKTNIAYEGITLPTRDVIVGAGKQVIIKLDPLAMYIQSNSDVEIDIADNTDLTFRAFRL